MKTLSRAILGGLVIAHSALATTVVKMDLPEIVQKSDRIVEAVVESVESRWDADRKLAFTYVTLRVAEDFKGTGSTITLKLLGGTVGALTVTVPGMPRFTPRERAIVFLRRQPDVTYDLVGLNQGVYEIVGDFAVSDLSGVELIDPKSGSISKPLSNQKTALAEFKKKIREALQNDKR
ncbi:MAG: hypothetical protein HY646_04620 [Acidobacteria bacterium]|nr:hypothetical protein [Acidobacteriota bacterium]